MTRVIITITLFLLTKFGFTQENNSTKDKKTYTITLSVDNFPNNNGKFRVALYDKETFLKKPILSESVAIYNNKANVIFNGLSTKEYAIIFYHDYNENNMLDFNQHGMPLEDYGNTGTINQFGPPSFKLAKFNLVDKNLNFNLKF